MDRPEFIITFRAVAHHPKLLPADATVFGYIYWMTRLKNEKCYASNDTLAGLTGLSVSTVRNSLQRLEEFGFIKRLYDEKNTTHREEIQPLMGFSSIMGATGVAGGVLPTQQGGATGKEHTINKSIYIDTSEIVISQVKEELPLREKKDTEYLKVFSLWENPPKNWRLNRTQIQAAKNLLEEQTLDGVAKALSFAAKHKDDPYCPEVTSPYDLDSKWAKLLAFKNKRV